MNQDDLPTTVESAVRILRSVIPEKAQDASAAMSEDDLIDLHLGLGLWIRNAFGLWKEDSTLRQVTGERDPDDAALAIIRVLWRSLRGERGAVALTGIIERFATSNTCPPGTAFILRRGAEQQVPAGQYQPFAEVRCARARQRLGSAQGRLWPEEGDTSGVPLAFARGRCLPAAAGVIPIQRVASSRASRSPLTSG